MAIKQVTPYLFFSGTAEKAIKHYEKALGAKLEGQGVMRFGDVPPGGNAPPCPDADKNRVMHALLHIGGGQIMISDVPSDKKASTVSNVEIVLDFDDVAETASKFDALAAGGEVTSPLQDTFWGAKFGTITDAYGIRWMFNCTLKK
ncbi:VOC family protein [Pendulispora brunnea]|uniref:VOC family protein n=1 Tax=Pendulispora brunnea TaxID=2905690 RepID=A0ABZ2K0T0_9BACT